ncbi:MAG: hypothetical protein ACOYK1_01880 [Vampirovibrionia bacterium]|jgi:hypothetical protein
MPITSVYSFGDSPANIKGSKTVITPDSNQPSQPRNSSDTATCSQATNAGFPTARESVGRLLAQPQQG